MPEIGYSIEDLSVEVPGMKVRPKRIPLPGVGKPHSVLWTGQHLWVSGSANCIAKRTQESGHLEVFRRDRGVGPTHMAPWDDRGTGRMLFVDPEGGFVGTFGFSGLIREYPFPAARPQAVSDGYRGVWIGCGGPPFLLHARGDEVRPFEHTPKRPVLALGDGPDGDLWCASGDQLTAISRDSGLGQLWKLPVRFDVRDLGCDTFDSSAYYCDEQRDVVGRISHWNRVEEFQLPRGTAPRRVRSRGMNIWFTGRGGRSLFHVDSGVAVEFPSVHADSDLSDFDFGYEELWCTEPNVGCVSCIPIKGL